MEKRSIGSVKFSPLTIGCMAVADPAVWGAQDEDETIGVLRDAQEYGISSFDTAPMYGNGYSEQLLGKAFHGSHDVVISTKFSPDQMDYQACITSCETSLRYLERDAIDLFQIHWPSATVPLEETARALIKLKEQGKIREIGVCNFGLTQLSQIMALCDVKSNQLMYNLFFRAPEFEMINRLQKEKLALMSYSSAAQGLLTGKYDTLDQVPVAIRRTRHYPCSMHPHSPHAEAGCKQEVEKAIRQLKTFCADNHLSMMHAALAWLLAKNAVTTVIVGARNLAQLQTNAGAMRVHLTDEQINDLDLLSADLKAKLGDNLDAWRTTGDEANRRIC